MKTFFSYDFRLLIIKTNNYYYLIKPFEVFFEVSMSFLTHSIPLMKS